jgi:hypothetical protein
MNKLFMTALAAVILAGAGTQCFAVLGETEAELEARHGKPILVSRPPDVRRPAEKAFTFVTKEFTVSATMFQGRSAEENYSVKDSNGQRIKMEQDLEKVNALLEANSQGAKWVSRPAEEISPHLALFWQRSDGKAVASVAKDGEFLEVIDTAFVAAFARAGGAPGQ